MLLLIVGIVESGLVLWSWQALEGAAIDAARCAAINETACKNPVSSPINTQTYAANAAAIRGLSGVTAANVTVSTLATAQALCGHTTVNVVSVVMSYHFPAMAMVPLVSNLSAAACFPSSTTS
jgi:Flp pilus assembly protein TadG